MTKKTHMVTSTLLLSSILLPYIDTSLCGKNINTIITISACTLSAALPDIDIPKWGKQTIWTKMFTHRGFTHTLVIPILLFSIGIFSPYIVTTSLIWGMGFGWFFHIIEDMFNRKGCPILYPISKEKLHIAKFRSNTWHEVPFIILWTLICITVVIFRFI